MISDPRFYNQSILNIDPQLQPASPAHPPFHRPFQTTSFPMVERNQNPFREARLRGFLPNHSDLWLLRNYMASAQAIFGDKADALVKAERQVLRGLEMNERKIISAQPLDRGVKDDSDRRRWTWEGLHALVAKEKQDKAAAAAAAGGAGPSTN